MGVKPVPLDSQSDTIGLDHLVVHSQARLVQNQKSEKKHSAESMIFFSDKLCIWAENDKIYLSKWRKFQMMLSNRDVVHQNGFASQEYFH